MILPSDPTTGERPAGAQRVLAAVSGLFGVLLLAAALILEIGIAVDPSGGLFGAPMAGFALGWGAYLTGAGIALWRRSTPSDVVTRRLQLAGGLLLGATAFAIDNGQVASDHLLLWGLALYSCVDAVRRMLVAGGA